MLSNILILVPLILLLFMALTTRRIAESLLSATLLALFLVYGRNSFQGSIDTMYETLSNESYQYVLLILLLFGPVIKYFQESGALNSFGKALEKYAYGKKRPLVIAWLLCILLFADEYMSALAVSHAMRGITDKNGIPREHLAMQDNAMAACIAVFVPLTSWTAFSVGLIRPYGMDFADYVRAVPTMFFPMAMILIMLLTALGIVPKLGNLKKAYERVEGGGSAVPGEAPDASENASEGGPEENKAKLFDLLIPLALLIIGLMLPGQDLLRGLILALIGQFVLYTSRGIISIKRFFDLFFEGARSMLNTSIIVGIGFTFCGLNDKLGTFGYIINTAGTALPGVLLPMAAFLTVGVLTFATGESWVMQVIAMPVFIPLAMESGVSAVLTLSALMSGISLGYCLCFYADAVLMTSGATAVPSVELSKTSMPYALIATAISAVLFALLGILS